MEKINTKEETFTITENEGSKRYTVCFQGKKLSIERTNEKDYIITSSSDWTVSSGFTMEGQIFSCLRNSVLYLLGTLCLEGDASLPRDTLKMDREAQWEKVLIHSDQGDTSFSLFHGPADKGFICTLNFYGGSPQQDRKVVIKRQGKYHALITGFDLFFEYLEKQFEPSKKAKTSLQKRAHLLVQASPQVNTLNLIKPHQKERLIFYQDAHHICHFLNGNRKESFFSIYNQDEKTEEGFLYKQFLQLMVQIYGEIMMCDVFTARQLPKDFLDLEKRKIVFHDRTGKNQKLELTHEKGAIQIHLLPIDEHQKVDSGVAIRMGDTTYLGEGAHFYRLFDCLMDAFGKEAEPVKTAVPQKIKKRKD